jgi:endogenous inhibitor of DNA gyrase (YacG/DUF329 family)
MKNEYQKLWNKKYLRNIDLNFKELEKISKDLNLTNPRQILFHAIHSLSEIPKCICNKDLSWNTDKREYRIFCSKKCTAINTSNERKVTSLEKYGVDHFSKTKEFAEKIKETSKKKFNSEHYSQTDEFKNRMKLTSLEKYNTDHPMKNKEIIEKSKKIFLEKYGVDNPTKHSLIREKISLTNLKKYGANCVLKNPDIKDRIKQTNLNRYGVENPLQNSDIHSRGIKTFQKNYYSTETLNLLNDRNWLAERNSNGDTIHEIAKDLGVSSSQLCKHFHKLKINIVRHHHSSHEKQILEFLKYNNIEYLSNYRKLIHPYEIDIAIPKINLAIEINGGFWHHEDAQKGKFYHLNKTKKCDTINYQLWHFFDWEIEEKLDIILSMLSHKLHLNNSIYARKLNIREISRIEKDLFLESNHMQGTCNSSINLGLEDNNKTLYSVMTFGKSRFNKKYKWELLRFCNLKNHAVVGAGGKLLSHFKKTYQSTDNIISYCNLRWSKGNFYESLGFKKIGTSPPGYCYVSKNGSFAGTRNQFQKHLLEKKLNLFDASLSEVENMKNNGYHRIWDCGQLSYTI